MYEDACTQGGYHSVRNQQEARNIEKGHTPGQTNVYQLKIADQEKETYEEAKRDKKRLK
jgi:hypothetical protein